MLAISPGALAAVVAVIMALCQHAAAGQTLVNSREELADALRGAKPGTTILIAPGEYRGGLSQAKLTGDKHHPILIAAADPKNPPVITGGGSGLHLSSPAYVELRDVIFRGATGNGLNIDDGGAADAPAHDLVLKNVVVDDVGPRGNADGIKLSGVRDFRVEGAHVRRWGAGGSAIDMVGCSEGAIVDCQFTEARGQLANGVQTKGGSSRIAILHCRFEDAGGRAVNAGGSTGRDFFRRRDATFEARDITVEDCEFLGGSSAIAFVGIDGAIARHNTIYRPKRWVFRILQENTDARFTPSRNARIEKNVIAFRSDEVRQAVNVGENTSPETFAFWGNAWHCLDRPAQTRRHVRLPGVEEKGRYGAEPKFKNAEKGDIGIADRQSDDPGARPRSETAASSE